MTTKQFIEKAIEGGWYPSNRFYKQMGVEPQNATEADILKFFDGYTEPIFLDPLAWQAVGKVEGWMQDLQVSRCEYCGGSGMCPDAPEMCAFCMGSGAGHDTNHYVNQMHRLIDALAEGKSIEQYLDTLGK